jgi:hypothetical protein
MNSSSFIKSNENNRGYSVLVDSESRNVQNIASDIGLSTGSSNSPFSDSERQGYTCSGDLNLSKPYSHTFETSLFSDLKVWFRCLAVKFMIKKYSSLRVTALHVDTQVLPPSSLDVMITPRDKGFDPSVVIDINLIGCR